MNHKQTYRLYPEDGLSIRIRDVVAIDTREALSTQPRANFRPVQVVGMLDGRVHLRGKPQSLRMDNVPDGPSDR